MKSSHLHAAKVRSSADGGPRRREATTGGFGESRPSVTINVEMDVRILIERGCRGDFFRFADLLRRLRQDVGKTKRSNAAKGHKTRKNENTEAACGRWPRSASVDEKSTRINVETGLLNVIG